MKKTAKQIFATITCNGNREMTEERFLQALNEFNNSLICPICGKKKVKTEKGLEHICEQKIK